MKRSGLERFTQFSAHGSHCVFPVTFAHPWMLTGLLLTALPVVIHLFQRRTRRETEWAAMQFLLTAMRRHSKRVRIEEFLLLALRTVLIAVVVLAMAGPTMRRGSVAGPPPPVIRILVFDTSLSMSAWAGKRSGVDRGARPITRFDRMKAIARRTVMDSGPRDRFVLVIAGMNGPVQPWSEPITDRDRVLEEVDRLTPTDSGAALLPSLIATGKLLEQLQKSDTDATSPADRTVAEVVILSDFPPDFWNDRADRSALRTALEELAERSRLVAVADSMPTEPNLAIVDLEVPAPVVSPRDPLRVRIAVHNFNSEAVASVPVRIRWDDRLVVFTEGDTPRSESTIDLNAGETGWLEVFIGGSQPTFVLGEPKPGLTVETDEDRKRPLDRLGTHRLTATLGPVSSGASVRGDLLPGDDSRSIVLTVRERIPVLLAGGAVAGDDPGVSTRAIRLALNSVGGAEGTAGAIELIEREPSRILRDDPQAVAVVVLANRPAPGVEEAKQLAAYVRRGGSLLITLGSEVEPEAYNVRLADLLPGRLTERVGNASAPEAAWLLETGAINHPIFAPFVGQSGTGLESVLTFEYFRIKPEAAELLADGTGEPTVQVPLRFENGDPVLIERRVGHGRVVVLTTSLDSRWTTWTTQNFSFVPFLDQTVRYLATVGNEGGSLIAGKPIRAWVPQTLRSNSWRVRRPDGRLAMPETDPQELLSRLVYRNTNRSGFYSLIDGNQKRGRSPQGPTYAVNPPTEESQLAISSPDQLRAGFPEGAVIVEFQNTTGLGRQRQTVTPPNPLPGWLLFIAVGCFAVDLVMTRRFRSGLILLVVLLVSGTIGLAVTTGIWWPLLLAMASGAGIITRTPRSG